MKATKLMLNDWVLHNGAAKRVDVIWSDHLVSLYDPNKDWGSIYADRYETSEISPISLTPEILEKNGFDISDGEVMQFHFTEDDMDYHFSLRQMYNRNGEKDGFSFFSFNVLTLILYVHELQHALRLCGIDKEIVI